MIEKPKVLFLKQEAFMGFWFVDLGIDIANKVGTAAMYTSVDAGQIGDLRIIHATGYRRGSDLVRIASWLRYAIGAAWHAIWSGRPLLFIVTESPFLSLVGYLLNLFIGLRYVLWVGDIHPEQFNRLGRLRESGIVAKLWYAFNRIVFDRADVIFTLSGCMAQTLARSLTPLSQQKIVIVPTWTDVDAIKPIPKNENWFAQKYAQTDKLTFMYSGYLGYSYDLTPFIEAAREFRDYDDIHFMLIGEGPRWNELETLVNRYNLTNVTILPLQSSEVFPYSLSTGDVAIVSLVAGMEGVSMPGKTYNAMAAGAAILGVSRTPSDLQQVIQRYQCGLHIEDGDVSGFIQAVRRFYQDRPFLETCRRNARHAAVEEFSRVVNVERVFRSIEALIPREGSL